MLLGKACSKAVNNKGCSITHYDKDSAWGEPIEVILGGMAGAMIGANSEEEEKRKVREFYEGILILIKIFSNSPKFRFSIIGAFVVIALLGILELIIFGISPPIGMIKTVIQNYLLITYIYAFILFLLYTFYFLMGGQIEGDRGALSMYGPPVYMILSIMLYSSVFYIALVMLFHIFNGTFSNEFQLNELMILGAIMAYLV